MFRVWPPITTVFIIPPQRVFSIAREQA